MDSGYPQEAWNLKCGHVCQHKRWLLPCSVQSILEISQGHFDARLEALIYT